MAQKPVVSTKANANKGTIQKTSFLKDDFPTIRKASMTLAICLTIAALMIFSSRYYLYQQEKNRQLAQLELTQAHEKYSEVTTERNNIRDYRQQYLRLVELGFVGEEKRLDLIELIRTTQETSRLLPITYTLAPQQTVEIDPSIFTSELTLHASKLVLNMGNLHELDIFTLMKSLRSQFTLSPQSCSLKASDVVIDTVLAPRLQVECSLYLLTMSRIAPVAESEEPTSE
jgi:cell division protein FtsL